MKLDVPRAVTVHLLWIGCVGGAFAAAAGGLLPAGIGSIDPESALSAVVHAQLFFVLIVWPYFIPRLVRREGATLGTLGESPLLLAQVLLLCAAGLPLALVGENLSEAGISALFRGQLMVLAVGAFVTILHDVLGAARVRPWYFLGAFAVSAVLPYAGYLAAEFAPSWKTGAFAAVSPFWAAENLARDAAHPWAPLTLSAIFGVAAVALLAAAPSMRPVDPSSARG